MLRIRYWLVEKSWSCEKHFLFPFYSSCTLKKKWFCMCLVNKDAKLHYECLIISKINPYIFVTSANCLDQMGCNNCGYFIKKALYLQRYYYFSVSACYSKRHKQKPLVTSDRSVTSVSKHEMNSDTCCDKPKQIIPQIQLHREILM